MSDINWNRLLSLIVAVAYLVIAAISDGGEGFLRTGIFLALPMAAIWYGDELGDYVSMAPGMFSRHPVTQRTPGIIVTIGGWILLLSPVIAGIIVVATK